MIQSSPVDDEEERMSFRTIRDPYDPISALRSPVYDEEELERDERSRMSLRADGSCPSLEELDIHLVERTAASYEPLERFGE
jgi:hypothetical protein